MTPEPQYVIWSEQHGAWWAHLGYTSELSKAGRYSPTQAQKIVIDANQYLHPPAWHEIAFPDPLNPNPSAHLIAILGLSAIQAARLSTPGATTSASAHSGTP
jgi:hypothetical protein